MILSNPFYSLIDIVLGLIWYVCFISALETIAPELVEARLLRVGDGICVGVEGDGRLICLKIISINRTKYSMKIGFMSRSDDLANSNSESAQHARRVGVRGDAFSLVFIEADEQSRFAENAAEQQGLDGIKIFRRRLVRGLLL